MGKGTCAYTSRKDLQLIDQWIMMNIGVGGGHEYGDEMLTEMPGWADELMRKTDHKVANDYSGKEKRHTDFWGNPPEQIVNILWNIKSGIFLWKSIDTHMQSHIDSIHSPQRTRKTIMKLCMKSVKFHLGIIFWGNRSTLSEIRSSCQMISQDALPRICHCVIKNSSLRISPFAPNLYSFCRRAACPWQRRWRWWYRGRMWGFPEHQWFSP